MAFEVHDAYIRKIKMKGLIKSLEDSTVTDNSNEIKARIEALKLETDLQSLDAPLTFLDMFGYSYCYVGILTGPYFKVVDAFFF